MRLTIQHGVPQGSVLGAPFVYYYYFFLIDDLPLNIQDAKLVDSSWNVMAHGDAGEGKWSGNWWMEWVASTLHTTQNMVYPALLPPTCTPQLPELNWTDAPTDLNGLVCLAERQNLVSARVSSHFNWPLLIAGDINNLITDKNIDTVQERLNRFMKHSETWFSNNNLINDTEKTKAMIFHF